MPSYASAIAVSVKTPMNSGSALETVCKPDATGERNSLVLNHEPRKHRLRNHKLASRVLLGVAGLNCTFQILWFWKAASQNVNIDAISYIGIARHLAEGDFRGSLHGYWSPLVSWLIALISVFSSNYTLLARLVTIASFLACLPLLYLLTLQLWGSRLLAALAVLWFTTARGVTAFSVSFIGADFLLTASSLAYFLLLFRCLRKPSSRNWLLPGILHAIAFLAKAIAMPWLLISTLVASFLAARCDLKRTLICASAGIAIPLLVWCGWGAALKTKYGVFTAGYQSRWNLLDQNTRELAQRQAGGLLVLTDTSRSYDSRMVIDNMFPGSPLWQARVDFGQAMRSSLRKEHRNLPAAIKEVAILLTPGGVLGLILALVAIRRQSTEAATQFVWIACLDAIVLMVAYGMLVFDTRYVLPFIPVLMAIVVPFVWPGDLEDSTKRQLEFVIRRRWRIAACALLVASTLFFQVYWASPFRTLRRDYQLSCYAAARNLRAIPSCKRLVAIGSGPFPEHGVGWEDGIYSSYFAGCRLVAFSDKMPGEGEIESVVRDLRTVQPDAILLFGGRDRTFLAGVAALTQMLSPSFSATQVSDLQAGQVGELFWKQAAKR